jgi:hypothetical protein
VKVLSGLAMNITLLIQQLAGVAMISSACTRSSTAT